jgi:competence protein ComGC
LLLGGLFTALVAVTMLSLLRPTALTLNGADLVYLVGGRETRAPRETIATCALVGQRWVFGDAAGAVVLSLPALRFNQTDLAAFCNKVGIHGFAPQPSPVDQGRKDVRSARSTRAFGVVTTLMVLFILGFSIWLTVIARDALTRYRSAPICEAGSTASTCRLQTQARVISTEENHTSTTLHLSLVASGGNYIASVSNGVAPSQGDVVGVEVWNGKVTRLGESDTLGNPEVNPNLGVTWVLGVWGFFLAVTIGIAVVGHMQLRLARARLRAATAAG